MINTDPDELFVYGSLKPDFGLFHLIAGYVDEPRPASTGGVMFRAKHGMFPYVVFGKGGMVHGELLHIKRGYKDDLIRRLDAVEGHPTHYKRRVIKVILDDDNSVEDVWAYDAQYLTHCGEIIKSGIWEEA